MKIDAKTVDGSFVVWPWDKAPLQFRERVVEEHGDRFNWLILTQTKHLENGIPFWVDVMNPMDSCSIDLPNGVTIVAA